MSEPKSDLLTMGSKDSLLPVHERASEGSLTTMGAISVLAKTIIGAAVVLLSSSLSKVGLTAGTILIIIAGSLSAFTLRLLSDIAIASGRRDMSFYQAACSAFPKFKRYIDFAIFIKCVGVVVAYLSTIAKTLSTLFGSKGGAEDFPKPYRAFTLVITAIFVILPFSLPTSLKSTKPLNLIALSSLFYISLLTLGTFLFKLANDTVSVRNTTKNLGYTTDVQALIVQLPVFIFAFTCHQNIFSIANEIKSHTKKAMNTVISVSVVCAFIMYMLCAVPGFFMYDAEDGIHLELFKEQKTIFTYAAVCGMWLSMALSVPMQVHPGRNSFISMVYGDKTISEEKKVFVGRVVTILMVAVGVTVASIFPNNGLVFSLVGTIGSNLMSIIIPCALYIKYYSNYTTAERERLQESTRENTPERACCHARVEKKNVPYTRPLNIGAVFGLAFGIILLPIGVYVNIKAEIDRKNEAAAIAV